MKSKMTFGPCLKYLLSTLNIPMSQLAKAINVDASLVNRWVHEKRIPSDSYITYIAEFLSNTTVCPIQLKLVDELINSIDDNITISSINYRDKYNELMNITLQNSLRLKAEKTIVKKVPVVSPVMDQEICLSGQDKLIYGFENIHNSFLYLLELASNDASISERKIYISYRSDLNTAFYTKSILNTLKQKLLTAVMNDWEIIFLLQSDINTGRLIEFFNFLLPLIQTKKFKLFYSMSYEEQSTRKELYIVNGLGAISCFPVNNSIDCGFLITNPHGIEVFTRYAGLLISTCTKNVIKYFRSDIKGSLFTTLSELNVKRGKQYSYNNIFSLLLLPQELYIKYLDYTDLSPLDKQLSIEWYMTQCNSFFKNLLSYRYIDIYFISILDKLCEDKLLYLYTHIGKRIVSIEIPDIIKYLQHTIYIITTYTNYQIAFLDKEPEDFLKNISFLIKERQFIFLNLHNENKKSDVRIAITDSTIIRAFVLYINSIWHKIPFANKNKQDVISFLEDYIIELKNEISY